MFFVRHKSSTVDILCVDPSSGEAGAWSSSSGAGGGSGGGAGPSPAAATVFGAPLADLPRLELESTPRRPGPVCALAVHHGPTHPYVAAGTGDGVVAVWRCSFLTRLDGVGMGRRRGGGGAEGVVVLSSTELGREAVVALAFHPVLPLLAAADGRGHVLLFRVGTGRSGRSGVVAK